jgi:hypothetical protein
VIPPPAYSMNPQFTPEYWDKVPRTKEKVKLLRMTKMDGGFTEYVFDNGQAFQRRDEQLSDNVTLHVNLTVYVETVGRSGEQLVTGMWVPEQGWAFRMTSQDLAQYAQKLTEMMVKQRNQARDDLRRYIALALRQGLAEQVEVIDLEDAVDVVGPFSLDDLARYVMDAMAQARSSA